MTRGRDSLVCFVLFVNLLQNVIVLGQQQTGFISISCGSMDASHRDTKTGINYVSDVGTVSAGETAMIANEYITSVAKNLQHLRRFPFGRRNCIDNLGPVTPGSKYLLRASFMYGNYDALNSVPVFDFYLGTNFIQTVNGTVATPRTIELMFVATDTNVSVCLLKTTSGVPFISSIELRPMSMGGYTILNSTTAMLTRERFSFGTASREDIRYPDDVFDRLWTAPDSFIDSINTTESVKPSNNDFNPPSLVMQNAIINSSSSGDVQWNTFGLPLNASFYTCLHLAELQRLREGQIREFTITVSGTPFKTQQPAYLTSTTECSSSSYLLSPPGRNRVLLLPTARSTLSPILNAFELFQVIPLSSSVTDGQDVDALRTIKDNLKTKANWTGDPCLPQGYAWENIVCSNGSSPRVTSLDLSNSGLNGEIPSSLSKMSAIVSLNLANNNLTGSIPSFLGDLPKLNYLNLSGNSLSGAIPDALLSKNQSGSLLLSIDGNKDLCLSGPCGKKNTKSIVIGSVIAVVVLIVAACVATWMILRSRSKKRLEKESDKALGMPRGCKAFSYSELKSITNNFSTKIGEGGYGPVFHGHLQDGQDVAVKILSHKSTQGSKEFYTEVALLSRVHHKNLVTFFGYCDEAENMILVYEYISSGNLQDVISGSTQITLDWNQRLQIAFNAAQGLDYLHSGCKPAIIHRDIKCANILLNEKLEAKIADFGMSKSDIPDGATHISTVVVGTQGYLDPEYYLTNHINEKSDVFSFGVVLLELITGRQPIIVEPSGERTHIANWIMRKKQSSARDVACARTRLSRQHRKVDDNIQMPEKKITDLITSSARKQTVVNLASKIQLKKINCVELSNDLTDKYLLERDLDEDARLATNFDYEAFGEHKGCPQEASQFGTGTIFSPGFQFSECVGSAKAYKATDQCSNIQNNDPEVPKSVDMDSLIAMDASHGRDLQRSVEDRNGFVSTSQMEELEVNRLTAEGLPLCLEIQQENMECDDDLHPETTALQVYLEDDEDDEMDNFNPYLFIRNLPDLSTVVPTFRSMILPRQTRSCPSTTLVLDLDETLVHSTLEHCDDADFAFPVNFNLQEHKVYVRCRPHLMNFMEKVASMFEIIIFTASQSIYAEQLLNMLDPKRKIFRHRVYRESCVFVDGNYLKDLTVLGRDMARIAIIDNSPQAFGFQVDNGIPIESWFDDRSDDALISLLPFLETLVGVDDVRPLIAKEFNLRTKVAAAVDPYNV